MSDLTPDSFSAFFEAIYGTPPFPWQTRLARHVVETGQWPSLLDLPTSAGKTAAIDVAVFHLACEASRGAERRAPLRILFVIDRRIVVDAAFERAKKIAEALRRPNHKVVAEVARCLSTLSRTSPLDVVRLRGGVPQERDWARSPAQPLVAISTVDQAGSRLLFRGYGVSPKMWPVHAGLVGSDALWMLDEVHLSRPLEQTLGAILDGHSSQGTMAERPRLAPFAVVKLSATPGEQAGDAFTLHVEDLGHPLLKPRLDAHKRATLETIEGDAAAAFAGHALKMIASTGYAASSRKAKNASDAHQVRRLAVVVNRVNLAREVFQKLDREMDATADVLLLTGRIRPLDRDRLFADERLRLLFAASRGEEPTKPIILVATQTIEAGADLDVDALVTEIAPLDCLRQRFGRLDRLGTRGDSRAIILSPKAREAWKSTERLYGEAPRNTKNWLDSVGSAPDLGIEALRPYLNAATASGEIVTLLAPRPNAPVLLPVYADLWATTSPAPAATPEPSLFLHGPSVSADVQVVWRADVDPTSIDAANLSLELCPPSALEALPAPIWAVRVWLRGEAFDNNISDVPERGPETRELRQSGEPIVLRYDGENWSWVSPGQLRPGDTIVVPAKTGGCDAFGWNPDSTEEVTDLGAEAHYRQRLKGVLRVTPAMLANAMRAERTPGEVINPATTWDRIAGATAEMGDDADAKALLSLIIAIDELPEIWRRLALAMKDFDPAVEFYSDQDRAAGFLVHSPKPLPRGALDHHVEDESDMGAEAISESEASSAIGVVVTLADHLDHVGATARDFAHAAGLDARLVDLVTLAARLHDLGKADPRFQADLCGKSALARMGLLNIGPGPLLAKSDRTRGFHFGQRASPDRFRHEALSVVLAARHPAVLALDEDERDLVLWLIGTHHGYGRPFFPPSIDPQPTIRSEVMLDALKLTAEAREAPLKLDQGWFDRAARLNQRYGPWELARLEAMLRLADHVASAEEQIAVPSPAVAKSRMAAS
jgi:CRISPR-associated endonuclease/helicase Cas3